MSYATVEDFTVAAGERQLAELTNPDDPETVDAAVAQRALDDATAEMNGYIEPRYKLPFADPPAALRGYCASIALYKLYGRRGLGADDDVRKRYEDAVRFLERVADGKQLLGPAESGAKAAQTALPAVSAIDPQFNRDGMKGF